MAIAPFIRFNSLHAILKTLNGDLNFLIKSTLNESVFGGESSIIILNSFKITHSTL